MATNLTEVETYTASVPVPDPGDARNVASIIPAFQALANRTKKLRAMAGLGTIALSNLAFVAGEASGVRRWQLNNAGLLVSADVFPYGWYPLDAIVVPGCTIVSVSVRVDPGVARATSGNRITLSLVKRAHANASSWANVGASVVDDGTSAEQLLTATTNEAVDTTAYAYAIQVIGGVDADTNLDKIAGAAVVLS